MKKQKQIDPNILIDIAARVISDKPAKTLVGKILRWIKKLNGLRNSVGIKIK